ncbi:MAG: SGNH/GDSL hydrolase family protein [Clostridia bacterium]|nr:SGNH/GDSL hydrolase family protein [Clostridia bacterium]
MILTNEKIRELTVGACAVYEENDGLRFAKCTADQLAAWKEAAAWCYGNAVGSTGVRMDFRTDSGSVTFTVAEYGKYDVKIDGLLREHYEFREALGHGKINRITVTLPAGIHRVTFVLPSHGAGGVISSVEVDDGAFCERQSYDTKVLFIGDSITQGWNTKFDSMSYAYLVSEALNAESVIQGVGGAVFAPSTIQPIGFDPDIVFVAYGTNDWGCRSSYEEYRNTVHDTLAKVRELYGDAEIFVISPIWREDCGKTTKAGTFVDCCGAVKEMAHLFGMNLIDGDTLVPPIMDYMADAVHPNDLGFAVYAANVLKNLG